MTFIDRLAIVWGVVVFALVIVTVGSVNEVFNYPGPVAKIMLVFVVAPWLLLRAIRWAVLGGR